MISRTAAALSGVLGGLCWIARYVLSTLDVIDPDGSVGVALKWAGATWLLIALAGAGISLVRRAPVWLRVVLGVAVPMLALVFLSLAYGAMDDLLAEALFGTVILAGSLLVMRRTPRQPAESPEGAGTSG